MKFVHLLAAAVVLFVVDPSRAANPPSLESQNAIAIEALRRLKGIDLESNPAIKAAVVRVLDSVRGTPQFVELVRDFNLQGQEESLLEVALKQHSNNTGADAARIMMETDAGLALLRQSLNSGDPDTALKTAVLLGNISDKRTVPILLDVIADPNRDPALRKQAVKSIGKTQEGSEQLLALAKADKLSADLKLTASMELNQARWPEIKSHAAEILPLPQSGNAEPLPPISELVKRRGDPKRGSEIYSSETVACSNCHQVNGKGIDFGPKLSEIGTKLGKDALYEAILDPNAGVSFGYEGWQIELKNGDEAFGIIVSETAEHVAVKAQNGIVTEYKKSDIARRTPSTSSLMPAGLQQAMTVDQLVDLVEYLASLKKQEPPQ